MVPSPKKADAASKRSADEATPTESTSTQKRARKSTEASQARKSLSLGAPLPPPTIPEDDLGAQFYAHVDLNQQMTNLVCVRFFEFHNGTTRGYLVIVPNDAPAYCLANAAAKWLNEPACELRFHDFAGHPANLDYDRVDGEWGLMTVNEVFQRSKKKYRDTYDGTPVLLDYETSVPTLDLQVTIK